VALTSKYILTDRHAKKPAYHKLAVLPVDSFALPKHDAKPTSNKPAIINITQFIAVYLISPKAFYILKKEAAGIFVPAIRRRLQK
jgi:hypothetical protein